MSKIFIVMGKSATGKDTIFKELKKNFNEQLKAVILYTTRPIRTGETEGIEYHFVSKNERDILKKQGKIIEERMYQTVSGDWYYFTVDDGQFDLEKQSYIMISTLEGYESLLNYFGREKVVPIYIEVEDGERLQRALTREKEQIEPKYEEMCRRFLADQKDFEEQNLARLGVEKRYINSNKEKCIQQILSDIVTLI
ncbi:nucleoside/nucleotide kinase family protein [[Clostridium] polysaccharolyticum]|uniref:Guanylate kinase n=1 Tax=[Clostridium] polysaccharolyticum TaxID=29364 RepID=A0A1I0FPB9_9FIRM|nr:guanylate kinase [[Clostridium] polysaccharolyticum]SET59940.1 Guanylate kinase [[Clostridium] polysaccharolyticum]